MPATDALQRAFGLGRASWLTYPRVLMNEMPSEWQERMAALMEEWDDAWDTADLPTPSVVLDGVPPDAWVHNYRYPDREAIEARRIPERGSS